MERLRRFFGTIVQRAFWELGLSKQPVVEDASEVLTDFAHADHLYRLRSIDGERVEGWVRTSISNN